MGLSISIGASGVTELQRTLAIQAKVIKDLRPAWDKIEKLMIKTQKGVFAAKGAYGGLPAWKDLKPNTIKYKKKHFPQYANHPLIRTGALRDAWIKDGSGSVRIKEPLLFAYGIDENEIPYAKYHQSDKPRKSNLPRRAHLRLTSNIRQSIVKIIQTHLVKSGQFQRETVFST